MATAALSQSVTLTMTWSEASALLNHLKADPHRLANSPLVDVAVALDRMVGPKVREYSMTGTEFGS